VLIVGEEALFQSRAQRKRTWIGARVIARDMLGGLMEHRRCSVKNSIINFMKK
jgi:hypothetical protein